MRLRFTIFTILLFLFACKSSEDVTYSAKSTVQLSDKEEKEFGRLYIDASKEKILGNIEKSKDLYQKAININPRSAAAHYELGLMHNASGDNQTAFEEFKIANQLDPQNYWYKLSYATFLESQGKIDEAIHLFKELVEENPKQLEIKYELSKLLLNRGKIEEGINYLNMIESEIGVTEEISFLKQRIYLSTNNVEKAANEIELLIQAIPSNVDYYNILANIYLSNEMPLKAAEVLESLEAKNVDDYRVQFSLAQIYKEMGETEKYKKYISLAFENPLMNIDQKVKFILSNYQVSLNEKEKINEAVELAKLIAKAHPDNAKSHALLADFLYFADRDKEAMDSYRRTIELDSSRFPVWNQLLVILSENQESELLLDYGPRAIELFPNQPTLYLIYGLGLSSNEQYEEAIDYLELGKDLVIDNQALKSQFYSTLGDIHHQLKDNKSSDENYEKALKIDPNNIYVLNNYSYYLSIRKENLDKAKQMSLKSNQIAPGQSSFQDTYAWILFQLGDFQEALVWIEKAVSSEANSSATLLEHKGDILFKLNKVDEALIYWKKAQEKGGGSKQLDQKIMDKQFYDEE